MKGLLVIWLLLMTLLECLMGFFLVFALAMSPMLFNRQEAIEDPQNWFLFFCVIVAIAAVALVLAFQWLFFFFGKRRLAFAISIIPLLVVLFRGPIEHGITRKLRESDGARSASNHHAALEHELEACQFNLASPNAH